MKSEQEEKPKKKFGMPVGVKSEVMSDAEIKSLRNSKSDMSGLQDNL
jgi:hypothetical protein